MSSSWSHAAPPLRGAPCNVMLRSRMSWRRRLKFRLSAAFTCGVVTAAVGCGAVGRGATLKAIEDLGGHCSVGGGVGRGGVLDCQDAL